MPRTGENIYHRSDGRYEGRYIASRDENGKARYKSVYADTKEEARVKLAEARATVAKEQMADATTFEEAYHAWMDDRRKHVAEASADRYEYLLERFVVPELGEMAVEQISPERIGVLAASLVNTEERGKNTISVSLAETLIGFTNSIISYAKGEDGMTVFRRGKRKESKPNHYAPLSAAEMRRLVSCARANHSPEMLGVMFALYTGIGTGELCALAWDDVDRKRREIYIHNTLYRIRNKGDGDTKTKLTVTEVRKSYIRTVSYPKELDSYVNEFYKKGTVFLTGEKDHYLEQRTFCNRLDRALVLYDLAGLTLQRVTKTFKEGNADIRFLQDPYYRPEDGVQASSEINEKWLIKEMENDLSSLRGILGLSGEEMGQMLGVSEGEYLALESGEMPLDWHDFMSLLFFFRYNAKTEGVVDALGLYTRDLREKMSIRKRDGERSIRVI